MTTSNAKKIAAVRKNIKMTVCRAERNSLAVQRAAGAVMLGISAAGVIIGGDMCGAAVLAPMALAAVFSKEKLLNFGVFSSEK